ncbi:MULTISPECIES: YlcI/YnfO family protein [Hydrogenophaga]|uniref:YlcI/YnfO family protein n=2 Tax=Hydrogenophaga TaxID=47420 RepID=A0ABW2QEW4_9BURK
MKTASLPPVRVAPEFRQELEGVLEDGETLSQFVESAVRSVVEKRKHQAEFVRRGIAAIQDTQRTGAGVPADEMLTRLQTHLDAAKLARAQRG